ncbi:autotransporter-associated beta strand repeat-containing protein [Luteolibacter yonseiensis]|uniref:Autotransporter-associated beta strand repeat-containing protein n=1 Tax=Luteolibacter yonseiensis TaxID=1144680 RepID=A0A934VDD5_9BACT|nr:autotransporter-associated beta strand repeat-containing protein [Luteolibacter yonseiensis]MBK1817449.1 autotransporter-associated beta strand repeat-containing protein [Luteolibacter yonseiensis]
MKPRRLTALSAFSRKPLGLRAAALLLAAGTSTTFAATLWWDGGASTVNSGSDNSSTTAQNWLSGGNWDNGTTSAPVATWTAGDSAVFGGTAANQTITAGTFSVGNLTFGQGVAGAGTSGTAYTVSGGTLTLTGSSITTNTPTALNSVLTGTTGLAKAGSSTLTLGGSNSYTGVTAINSGTLKITPSGYIPYRYYRFTVSANNGDGYNQLGELHYYNNGQWTIAEAGSAAPNNGASGTEQYWGNVNDNKGANAGGFTKFGVGGVPYSITYDMGSAKVINSYNWSSANDSTPARNPKRWIVAGSNDNSTWIPLDDRSTSDQAGPSNTYTWSGATTSYATVTNAANDGAANAYPISGSGNIPNTSDVQIATGATLDLNGTNQIVASLGNIGGGGGSITNSSATKALTLTLNPASGSTTFGGTISDSGAASAISLLKIGAGTQVLAGNNTYSGTTTINAGTLQLGGTNGSIGAGILSVLGGTFDLGGHSQVVQKLSGTAGSVSNTAAGDATLSVNLPLTTAGDFAGTVTTPSTGKLNLIVSSTSGGTASNFSLSNPANTFKGTITVNGTQVLTGVDASGVFGINTEGALGDPTNPIVLNDGGTLANMFNPNQGGGWPGHAIFTLGAERTITLTGIGGVIRTGYGELCTINSLITGSGTFSKVDGGGVTLGGSISNNYTGGTVLGGTGKLVLAKTGGALAIPGDVSLSSSGWAGNSSGLVLAANEQIADSAIITWTTNALGGGTQSASFLRTNGFTETVGGLESTGNGGEAVIENRGYTDTAVYGTGTVIVNVTGTNSYTFNGVIRDVDGGSNGGNVAITKTGTGTQILTGGGKAYFGATTVSGGVLQVDGTLPNTPVTVKDTGKLIGSGTLGGTITVQSGGILAPGDSTGFGTLTTSGAVTIGSGGSLFGPDLGSILNGAVTIASGGKLHGVGTTNGAVTVQAGGELAPGVDDIGNLTAKAAVSLAGNATFQVNKTSGQITNDTLSGFTNITYGGTLTINYTGSAPALNDTIQLFVPGPGATFSGSFSSIVGLPTLAPGLQWETTGLVGLGRIKVVNYVSTPSFNPVAGGYVGAQNITITSDSGSTIYYTINGSQPPSPTSPSGTSPVTGITIPTDSTVTIQAFARKAGQTDSPIATAVYRTITTPKWNVDESGLWSETGKWQNMVSPNAVNATVDFTLPQSAATYVTLDAGRTAGNLIFGNTEWNLESSDNSVLTLATSSGSPTITTSGSTTISATLDGTQDLVKSGPGTLTLSGTNTYTGNTTIEQAVLAVTSFSANGTGSPLGKGNTLSIDGSTLRYSGANNVGFGAFNRSVVLGSDGGTYDAAVPGSTFWFATGVISGTGPLTKTGAGQLIIQATNTFDGTFHVNEAEVQIRSAAALGSTVGDTTVADGARLCVAADITVPENFILNGNGGGNGALQNNDNAVSTVSGTISLATNSSVGGGSPNLFTLSNVISGPGTLTKLGTNAVALTGTASNTYAGVTTIGGTGKLVLAKTGGALAIPGNINLSSTAWNGNASGVVLGGDEQIADGSIITWTTTSQTGGTQEDSFLRLNGHTETVGGLVSTGSPGDPVVENRGLNDAAAYGTGTLIIQTTGPNSYNYNGVIRNVDGGSNGGTVALVKTGTGTQILSGSMSNTGTTTINAGALQLDGSAAFPVTVATGGTLKGSGSTSGAVTVNAGGFLAPGSDIGTLTTGNTTIAGTYAFEGNGSIADRLTVNGNLTITGATLAINAITPLLEPSYVVASYTGTLTGTFTVTGLPSGVTLQYDGANKQILLITTQAAGYSSWATSKGLTGANNGLAQDPDSDGVSNLLEFYLNGNPLASDAATLVTQSLDATYLTLAFKRRDDANTDVATQAAQYGSNLSGWTDVTIGAASSGPDGNGVIVDVAANGTDPDSITVRIPRSLAAGGKLFGRLKVTK